VKLESISQNMGLVQRLLLGSVKLGSVKVFSQNRLVLRMSALINDNTGTILGRKTSQVSKTLLGNDDVQVMLGLVNVGCKRNNARNAIRISLGRTR